MSAHTNAKATRLLSEGRVRPDDIRNLAFSVEGDNGSYRVESSCDCKASGSCSHLEAAMAWATASPDERAIMQQILDTYDKIRADAAFRAPLTDEQRASGEAAFKRL